MDQLLSAALLVQSGHVVELSTLATWCASYVIGIVCMRVYAKVLRNEFVGEGHGERRRRLKAILTPKRAEGSSDQKRLRGPWMNSLFYSLAWASAFFLLQLITALHGRVTRVLFHRD